MGIVGDSVFFSGFWIWSVFGTGLVHRFFAFQGQYSCQKILILAKILGWTPYLKERNIFELELDRLFGVVSFALYCVFPDAEQIIKMINARSPTACVCGVPDLLYPISRRSLGKSALTLEASSWLARFCFM